MNTTKPVRVKPYPIPFTQVSDVVKVDRMLKQGVIEPSKSPYCSPLLVVKKTDGTNRPVVDLRQLNRATTFDSEPSLILMQYLPFCPKIRSLVNLTVAKVLSDCYACKEYREWLLSLVLLGYSSFDECHLGCSTTEQLTVL